jgi:hypothetical protein
VPTSLEIGDQTAASEKLEMEVCSSRPPPPPPLSLLSSLPPAPSFSLLPPLLPSFHPSLYPSLCVTSLELRTRR